MTKEDLNYIVEKSYERLSEATAKPLRNPADFQKFYDVIASELKDIDYITPILRGELQAYRETFSYDQQRVAEMERDILNLDQLRQNLNFVYTTRNENPKTFNELTGPRAGVMKVLRTDYFPLLPLEITLNMGDAYKVNNDMDLIRYFIPFFLSPRAGEAYKLFVGGEMPNKIQNEKLYIRQTELLNGNDEATLTRSERLDFAANGFDRSSIKKFMGALQNALVTETNDVYRQTIKEYFDEIAASPAVAKHLDLV